MQKTIQIFDMNTREQAKETLAYWRSRPPAERIAMTERLRRHEHGTLRPIKRVVRIIEPEPS